MGYANSAAPVSATGPCLSSAIESLDPPIERAAKYADRIRMLSDRLHGSQLKQVGEDPRPDKPPQSLITSIHERRSRLVDILDAMEASITSLESGF